jgi:hypothetical protein
MVTGHNSNAVLEGVTYHVQTEARKSGHPFIDSLVFLKGRVLHRRSVGFEEMLPITAENEAELQKRVYEQHHRVVDEVRAGKVALDGRPAVKPAAEWQLDFLNPKGWLAKGRARIEVRLREKESQAAVAGVEIEAEIEGAAVDTKAAGKSGGDGAAVIEFAMPALGAGEAALVIRAGAAQRRFLLRAKAKS